MRERERTIVRNYERERERFVGRQKREKERDIISECEFISCFSFSLLHWIVLEVLELFSFLIITTITTTNTQLID